MRGSTRSHKISYRLVLSFSMVDFVDPFVRLEIHRQHRSSVIHSKGFQRSSYWWRHRRSCSLFRKSVEADLNRMSTILIDKTDSKSQNVTENVITYDKALSANYLFEIRVNNLLDSELLNRCSLVMNVMWIGIGSMDKHSRTRRTMLRNANTCHTRIFRFK